MATSPRIYYRPRQALGGSSASAAARRLADLGFDHVLIGWPFLADEDDDPPRPADHDLIDPAVGGGGTEAFLGQLSETLGGAGLRLLMDLDLRRMGSRHPLVSAAPDAFAFRRKWPRATAA